MIPSGDNRNNDIAAPSFSPTKESSSCISNEAMSPVCTASLSDASSSLPSSPTMNSLVASSLILEAQLNGTSDSCLAPSGRVLLTRDDSSIVSSRVRVRKVYGRLPKFCPFLGTFQHAPSAGNRSRTAFFEQHLLSEDEHERRKRIKTNPFTGTFHFYPGRYSSLHGLQRFRHHAGFLRSFDELDRLAALGRRVTQKVKEAGNPSLAAVFMTGIFGSTTSHRQRPSLYPHKSKEGAILFPDVGPTHGASRYRYGGAVDSSRKYGSSLDDCAFTNRASSAYREILYRWNGFRIHHWKNHRPPPRLRHHDRSDMEMSFMHMRSKSFSKIDSLTISITSGETSRLSSSISGSYQGLSRVVSSPSMAGTFGMDNSATTCSTPHGEDSLSTSGYRSLCRGRSPVRGLDVLSGGGDGRREGDAADRRDSHHHQGFDAPWMTRASSVPPPKSDPSQTNGVFMVPRIASPRSVSFVEPPKATAGGGGAAAAAHVYQRKVGDKYDVRQNEVLGEGSFAAVYGGSDKASGKQVAIKAIKRRYLFTEEEKSSVRNEIDNMKRIPAHRNIIRLLETFESVEHVYLVVERSSHGNLEQILQLRRKLTELETMWVVKQLLDATEQMHDAGVLHCDIKPQNLLFSDPDGAFGCKSQDQRMWMYTSPLGMVLKVCDFGLSRKVPDVRYFKHTGDIYRVPFSRICGTGGFIAPEIMRKQPFGKPADMWSIGVVAYRMLSGTLPFIPATKCLDTPVSFKGKVWDPISKEAQDFISCLLTLDQCRRATVKDALGHKFLKSVPDWSPLFATKTPQPSNKGRAADPSPH